MKDVLLQLLRRSPFKPFVVTLTSNETYCIEGAEEMSVQGDICTIIDPQSGRMRGFALSFIRKTEIKGAPQAH
jgi:hypothetical protein